MISKIFRVSVLQSNEKITNLGISVGFRHRLRFRLSIKTKPVSLTNACIVHPMQDGLRDLPCCSCQSVRRLEL